MSGRWRSRSKVAIASDYYFARKLNTGHYIIFFAMADVFVDIGVTIPEVVYAHGSCTFTSIHEVVYRNVAYIIKLVRPNGQAAEQGSYASTALDAACAHRC